MENIIQEIISLIKINGIEIEFFNYRNYDKQGLYLELSLKNKGE